MWSSSSADPDSDVLNLWNDWFLSICLRRELFLLYVLLQSWQVSWSLSTIASSIPTTCCSVFWCLRRVFSFLYFHHQDSYPRSSLVSQTYPSPSQLQYSLGFDFLKNQNYYCSVLLVLLLPIWELLVYSKCDVTYTWRLLFRHKADWNFFEVQINVSVQ